MRRQSVFRLCALALAACALVAPAVEAAGPKAYVGNFSDNTVSVVDLGAGSVVATIPVSAGPHGMAVAPDGRTVYLSGDGSSNLDAIDTGTDRIRRTIEIGKSPHGLAMMPDGKTLLAAIYGEDKIAFIDTATLAAVGSVSVQKPHTIAIRPDGSVVYIASQEPGKFSLVVVDLATRKVARSVPLDKPPRDLEFGFDGKALYFTQAGVNSVQVLDPATDRIVAQIPTGASPHIAGVYRGAAAGTAVVQGPGELLLFDPATNAPLRSIAVGKQPHWIAMANAGAQAVVTNEGSNDVAVVDLATGQTRTIGVGKAPRKVVVQPAMAAATAADAGISIANFAFSPSEIKVARGTRVTWTNNDSATHGLAHKDGAPGTGVLLPGQVVSRVYDSPGSFDYVCSVHPYMAGRVVVTAP
jgi:YVTN family beta-propeller protein